VYLSKLTLNPRHTQARRDLANPYSMHATLSWAVADREGERLLWRLEQGPREAILLVQSLTPPDWQGLFERHPGYAQLDEKSPKPFEPALKSGQILRFRLRANPTVTKFDPEKGKGKRLGLVKLEDQLAWLDRQAERGGFAVLGAMVSSAERIRARKSQKDGEEGRVITLQSVTYDGHLRVSDPDTFLTTLQYGLGHAKALGFGLLSIALAR
jgi:CRISPR system Cascade subunit CasE